MIDYPSLRADIPEHMEDVRNGHAYCPTCGYVDELHRDSRAARLYHGDTFGIELTYEEWEAEEAQTD